MESVMSGRSTAAKIIDGACYAVMGADLLLPIGVKLGIITMSPVAGAIVALANLGCVGWYIAS